MAVPVNGMKVRGRGRKLRALLAGVLGVTLAGSLTLASSGVAAPKATASSTVFYDGFSGSSLGSAWSKFSGTPSGSAARWVSSDVYVSGGYLNVIAKRGSNGSWTAGGIGAYHHAYKYGTWTARVRTDAGQGVTAAALLWPTYGWPPELDYYEVFPSNVYRSKYMTTTHGPGNRMLHQYAYGNFTQWHTVSVQWTPSMVRYLVDGRTITTTYNSYYIPKVSMWPAFQVEIGQSGSNKPNWSTPSTVKMQVDWIQITR